MKTRVILLFLTVAFAAGGAVLMPTLLPLLVFLVFLMMAMTLLESAFRGIPSDPKQPPRILSLAQWMEVAMLPAFFLLLFVVMLHIKYDYIRVMWEHPLGVKMMVSAVAFVALGTGAVAFLSFLKNQLKPEAKGLHFLLACGSVLTYLVLITPACFILLLGPAAIQIVEGFK
jgi:hypothetical protein